MSSRLRLMRRVVPFWILLIGVLALPSTAYGCSCALLDPAQMLEWSPVAFVGTVTGSVPVAEGQLADQALSFEVDTVLAGEVSAEVEVVTAANSAACGIDAVVGTRLAVFAAEENGQLHSNLCSVTDPDTAIKALGPGTAPSPGSPQADGGSVDWQAIGLGASGLAIVGAAWWLSNRRSTSSR